MKSLEEIIEKVSGNGRYQGFLLCLTLYANFVSSMNIIASIFTAGVPDSRCFISGVDDSTERLNFTEEKILKLFVPTLDDKLERCRLKKYDFGACIKPNATRESCIYDIINTTDYKESSCQNGYVYDRTFYPETIVTEWDLVCDKKYFATLSTSLFFLGFFFGAAIGGLISDRLGRVFTYRAGAIGGLILGVLISFSTNIYMFAALRTLQVVFFYQSTLASIVYGLEISRRSWRPTSGLMCNAIFGVGCCTLSLIALYCRGWRQVQIAISIPFVTSILISFFLPRSPRWLYSKGLYDESEEVLKKMAHKNGAKFDMVEWERVLSESLKEEVESSPSTFEILNGFLENRCSRILLFCNMSVWMSISLVYFGLILNSGNLGIDIYLSNLMGGIMEFLSCILSLFVCARVGSRKFVFVNMLLSSFTCLSSTVVISFGGSNPETSKLIAMVLAMIGRFGASAAFNTLFLQTMELFPTCGRTTALGLASMAARIGSIISPWTVQAQKAVPWLTPTIFGVITLVAAVINLNFPETLNKSLKMSFNEAESSYVDHFNESKFWRLFFRGKLQHKSKKVATI